MVQVAHSRESWGPRAIARDESVSAHHSMRLLLLLLPLSLLLLLPLSLLLSLPLVVIGGRCSCHCMTVARRMSPVPRAALLTPMLCTISGWRNSTSPGRDRPQVPTSHPNTQAGFSKLYGVIAMNPPPVLPRNCSRSCS